MTAYEVEWFLNHKYGEQAYVVQTEKQILIFTAKSKWIVAKNDYDRFHFYTLFHSNNKTGTGFHVQMRGRNIDYLVYCAIMHDNDDFWGKQNWYNFMESWRLFLLGREIESRAAAWDYLTK